MTTLDLALIAAIDARVKDGERDILAFGTVMSVDSDNDVTVTFDGSAASIPCKIFGNVFTLAGDRVGVAKVGAWWTVFGAMNRRWPSEASNQVTGPNTPGTTTSSSYADSPGLATVTFTKYFDATRMFVHVTMDTYAATAIAQVEYGVNVSGTMTAAFDQRVGAFQHNATSHHHTHAEWLHIPAASVPADVYTVKTRWRRLSGTGTLTQDQASDVALLVREAF